VRRQFGEAAIITLDPMASNSSRSRQRRRFAYLVNARLLCKEKVREVFSAVRPVAELCNFIHSTDNGREAVDYLRIIMPGASAADFCPSGYSDRLPPHQLPAAA
jgi:hypothetical protein